MQHRIPIADLGTAGEAMAAAVSACVHCGFCLAACPTYKVLGEEMDSPRGRIMLMKQALEGDLRPQDAAPYVDRCLGCLACETACPSGVRYRDLVVPFRARLEDQVRPLPSRAVRRLLLLVLESPGRFRASLAARRLLRPIARLLPARARTAMALAADAAPATVLPARTPARGHRRARIALLAGCVQQVLRPSINVATIELLAANGVEVLVPPAQACCGALAMHIGFGAHAHARAAHNRQVFPADVDAIVTTAAGCGSAMQEQHFAAPVLDVTAFLDQLGLVTPLRLASAATVVYQDACHLSHGQGVHAAPRRLLDQVAGLTRVEMSDRDLCCGSAGVYNLEHPEIANDLAQRKAAAIHATGASLVVSGNIGCLMQLQPQLAVPALHTAELLARCLGAHPAQQV